MIVYLSIYTLIFVMAYIYYFKTKNKERLNKIFAVVIFLMLLFIIGFRHPSMGHDLRWGEPNGYLGSFAKISNMSWKKVISLDEFLNYERGFIIYCKLISSAWNNQQFFLFISAFLSMFPVFLLIYKKSKNSIMSSLVYLGIPAFIIVYSGVRQGLAIGLCCLGMYLIQKRRPIIFLLTVLLASLFHSSALVFIFAYSLYYLKVNRLGRQLTLIALPIVYIFRYILLDVLNLFSDEKIEAQDTGAITLFLLFCLIYLFCLVFSVDRTCEINGYMNLFYIACICQAFAGVHNLAMRIGYYYMISLCLLLPELVNNMKVRSNKLLFTAGIDVGFLVFGIFSIMTTVWAKAYPYHFFWEML